MDNPGFSHFVDIAPGTEYANAMLPLADESIEPKTGIHSRYIASSSDTVASIAIDAVQKLFKELNIHGKDCAGLVLSSCTGDPKKDISSDLAAHVARAVGISGQTAGVNFACSGFPAAVEKSLEIAREVDRHIIIITAEILSRFVSWSDKDTATLFADRASAVSVINNGHEILDAHAWTVDDPLDLIDVRRNEAVMDVSGQTRSGHSIHMNGKPLYKRGPSEMVQIMEDSMRVLGLNPEDIGAIVPHQANGRFMDKIFDILSKKYGDDWEHLWVVNEIHDRGNVGSASIPSALARVQDHLVPGKVVVCPTIGAGPAFQRGKLTQGVVSFRVSSEQI